MPNPLPCRWFEFGSGEWRSIFGMMSRRFSMYICAWMGSFRDRQRFGKLPDFDNGKNVTLADVASSKGPSAVLTQTTLFSKERLFFFIQMRGIII
ncbi:hypothetical protein CDAR_476901 [Caerostris darwini]|uniref:Uncharacterized protein n=1 Tax=Caerostris darwini TaxID=1538125 RepID=A0AAV4U551_9ARAC|nr:hypothetical protein CDAR_476901 [Caerostris darwini]